MQWTVEETHKWSNADKYPRSGSAINGTGISPPSPRLRDHLGRGGRDGEGLNENSVSDCRTPELIAAVAA